MSIYCNYSVSTNSPESLPGNAVVHLPNILGKQLLFCSICNITFILLKVKVWNIISYFFHIRLHIGISTSKNHFAWFGINSTFNLHPNPFASLFNIERLGFRVPFSIRLISACVIPVLSDNSFCVIF